MEFKITDIEEMGFFLIKGQPLIAGAFIEYDAKIKKVLFQGNNYINAIKTGDDLLIGAIISDDIDESDIAFISVKDFEKEYKKIQHIRSIKR